MSEEQWVICAGRSVKDTQKFVGLRPTKAAAVALADEIARALYPAIAIEGKPYLDDVEYLHPDGEGGDYLFIRVFRYTPELEVSAMRMFKALAELHELNK